MNRENVLAYGVIIIGIAVVLTSLTAIGHTSRARRIEGRLDSIERIVGTEPPANMKWTAGHTYTTLVKHSVNCPCVTGEIREVK